MNRTITRLIRDAVKAANESQQTRCPMDRASVTVVSRDVAQRRLTDPMLLGADNDQVAGASGAKSATRNDHVKRPQKY